MLSFTFNRPAKLLPYLALLFLGGLIVIGVSLRDLDDQGLNLIYGLAIWALGLFFVYRGFGRRVTLDDQGIRFTSWHANHFIPWPEVKSYGGFVQSRRSRSTIPKSELDHVSATTFPYLYVSRLPHPKVPNVSVDDDYICLEYRPEALDYIEQHLTPSVPYGNTPEPA